MFILWPISIEGGVFEQKGGKKKEKKGGGMGGGTLQYVRGYYKFSKGTNLTVVARRHPFISPAWYCLLF